MPGPSRRGRRSHQVHPPGRAHTLPVGAAAWPRSGMHGARSIAARPPLPPKPSAPGAYPAGRSGRLAAKQDARCQVHRGEAAAPTEPSGPGTHPAGRSGCLAAKHTARSRAPSRRGRSYHQYPRHGVHTIPVGAAAWPRSGMHGARSIAARPPLPPKPSAPGTKHPGRSGRLAAKQTARSRNPSRRGRRSRSAAAPTSHAPAVSLSRTCHPALTPVPPIGYNHPI